MITFYNSKPRPQITLVSAQPTPPQLIHLIKSYIIRNVANPMKIQIPLKPAK